jgi:K+-transporting ATPase KdpF subunit
VTEAVMFEAFLGLAVALALGVYLVVTLIRPERF